MNENNNLVEYFFVGVGKSGTSWIYNFLAKYKLLSIPSIKEPYLIDLPQKKQNTLISKIYERKDKMSDFSTTYYWDTMNPSKIHKYNPNSKIIITVRLPSDRINSHFAFLQRGGMFTGLSLSKYLDNGDIESIVDRSDYWDMINRYVSVFGTENVLILPLELLRNNPSKYISTLCGFIGANDITPTEEDKKPVRPRSRARNTSMALIAGKCTSILRKLGLLNLLGAIKSSKLINKMLYVEENNEKQKTDFGSLIEKVNNLDLDYKSRIGEYL